MKNIILFAFLSLTHAATTQTASSGPSIHTTTQDPHNNAEEPATLVTGFFLTDNEDGHCIICGTSFSPDTDPDHLRRHLSDASSSHTMHLHAESSEFVVDLDLVELDESVFEPGVKTIEVHEQDGSVHYETPPETKILRSPDASALLSVTSHGISALVLTEGTGEAHRLFSDENGQLQMRKLHHVSHFIDALGEANSDTLGDHDDDPIGTKEASPVPNNKGQDRRHLRRSLFQFSASDIESPVKEERAKYCPDCDFLVPKGSCYLNDDSPHTMKIGIYMTHGLKAKKGTGWLDTFINEANLVMKRDFNIEFSVGKVLVTQRGWSKDIGIMSEQFADWAAGKRRRKYAAWHLFDSGTDTGGTLGQVDEIGGLCTARNTAVTHAEHPDALFIFLHEHGHLMGAEHMYCAQKGVRPMEKECLDRLRHIPTSGHTDSIMGPHGSSLYFAAIHQKTNICDVLKRSRLNCDKSFYPSGHYYH